MWVKNIEASPEVMVRFRRRDTPMVVRRIEGDDRTAAWSHMVDTWPNFVKYEQRTDRLIKVFQLSAAP
jgi:deazaflavin-dependent oxidoreductase (nitroreductase family)